MCGQNGEVSQTQNCSLTPEGLWGLSRCPVWLGWGALLHWGEVCKAELES